jgi:tRNA dimethylallyltransferase
MPPWLSSIPDMPRFTSQSLFLTGPTACGKSKLAIELAQMLDAEIIALDSMTLYRGMDIGTAKPSPAERAQVPHHLIDTLDPWETNSLDQYLRQAESICDDILARGKRPLFVGGTPLYLKGCLRGIFDGPPVDPVMRSRLEEEARTEGTASLHSRLTTIDPLAAARIAIADTRRIIRAIEVFEATGQPISHWQRQFDQPASPCPPVACLSPDRTTRHASINRRVIEMMNVGWIEEVRQLLSGDHPPLSRTAGQAVGYQEIIDHLEGRIDRDEMIDLIQTRTRQLSKRQMTWFRHLEEIRWFPISDAGPSPSLRDEIADFFRQGPQAVASGPPEPAQ